MTKHYLITVWRGIEPTITCRKSAAARAKAIAVIHREAHEAVDIFNLDIDEDGTTEIWREEYR